MFREGLNALDELDRSLIQALRVDGRAPFNRIAAVLETSPQTIARRYQRLRREVSLRVVGVADPHCFGETQWLLRVVASPVSAHPLAHALAKRPDTSWVKLMSGGTEITTIVGTATAATGHPLLLRDLLRTAEINSISAHCLLHTYLGRPTSRQWAIDTLTEEQQRQLRPPNHFGLDREQPRQTVTDTDLDLLKVLQHDGRADYSVLAVATGWTAATVARRLARLRASKALFFDIEIDSRALGVMTQAMLWLSVAPAHLVEVATRLAGPQ
ncbi:Lrp/AsnC family transcriptional regulator [Nocardia nepalensis]|uniref:Lrp/AsnC family transcriptional regulator n=1 Tax=Nocardia nepalensis TaxID=3375448 RepID=UPI003B68138F